MATGSYLSIITININGLNAPTKRQRLAEWIQKQDPYICCLQEIHLKTGDTYRLIVKSWKKIFHANRDQKKAGVAILISDKIDFKTKAVKRDKEGHYIMIKGSIQEDDITIINIYASNIGSPQYVRQMLTSMKGEINNNTIIVGDFHTPLTPMERSTKQKINNETQTLNDTIDQLYLIDIYRTFHPKTMNFTFFLFLEVCLYCYEPSLRTAFTVSHRFWVVVFSFSYVSMHILISFLVSSVICWLFSSVLFSLRMLELLIVFLL